MRPSSSEVPVERGFPELVVDLDRLEGNVKSLVELSSTRGVSLTGVVKGANGLPPVALAMLRGGCAHLASSRIEQLSALRRGGVGGPLMLLRIPAMTELAEVVRWSDMSLQSEVSVLAALDREAERAGKRHGVVLMMDLGDLREGWFEEGELLSAAARVDREFGSLELLGVGTNLGCYGSIRPTVLNLSRLVGIARRVEDRIGRGLDIVSGGATSSVPLLLDGTLPGGITNIRVGEGLLAARDLPLFYGIEVPGVEPSVFTLRAEVVEARSKPSYPVGEIFVDAFGERPAYVDRGVRRRALLAVGRRDFGKHEALVPLDPGVEIVGSSSDHLICDVEKMDPPPAPGDILEFGLFYSAMLFLTGSPSVRIRYQGSPL